MTLKQLIRYSTAFILAAGGLLLTDIRLNLPYDLLREREEVIITNRQNNDSNASDSSKSKPFIKTLDERIAKEKISKNTSPNKYAILISGQSYVRHLENISLAQTTLLKNGFKKENIYSIISLDESLKDQPKNYNIDIDATLSRIDASLSRETIKRLLQHLAKRISSQDTLLIYMTGHGKRKSLQSNPNKSESEAYISTLNLPSNETLSEIDLYNLLKEVKVRVGIFACDQCYGGGFATRIGGIPNFTGISASTGGMQSTNDTFPQAFFRSWQDNQADKNKDGRVSIEEAFKYARKHDRNSRSGSQTPLLISSSNPAKTYLN